jgi:hypothetical protein
MHEGYVYDHRDGVVSRTPVQQGQTGVEGGVTYQYFTLPACPGNVSPDLASPQSDCAAMLTGCPPGQLRVRTWRRQLSPPPAPGAGAERLGERCVGGTQRWTVPQLSAAVRQRLEALIGPQHIRMWPAGRAIAQLPQLVSTEEQAPIGFAVTVPLPGTLRAVPHYRWDFGDGTWAEGAGPPYDPDTLPSQHPDYYVAHAYTTLGDKPLTLHVTWQATFTVAGLDIPLQPLDRAYGPVQLPVYEARAALVQDRAHR